MASDPAMLEDGQIRPPARPSVPLRRHRLHGALLMLPPLALLVTAAFLKPNPAGMATHRQLGMPACGFLEATGHPCPSCGMTTAFAHAAHGDLASSFVTQPAGCILAVICAMLVLVGAWSVWSGMNGAGLAGRVFSRKAVWIGLLILGLAAWVWTDWRHG